jgi:HAD superfamily hydrolase (TIGR01549 family)
VEHTNLISNNFKALLFDFDGTLLDSFTIHYEIYKLMFTHFGIQIKKKQFLNSYSPNWYKTYEAMGLPKKDWKSADSIWVEEAERRSPNLLPGVQETLSVLSDGFATGLVTSGSKRRVVKDLERTGIKKFFKTVVTGDDIQTPKPSPEGLELALLNLGLRSSEVAYIGDADADHKMARAAGIYFIGVISDYASLNPIDPKYCIYSISDLPDLLGVSRRISS